jgi:hypothetical protein
MLDGDPETGRGGGERSTSRRHFGDLKLVT